MIGSVKAWVFLLAVLFGGIGAVCRFLVDTGVKNAMKRRYGVAGKPTARLRHLMDRWPKFEFLGTVPMGTMVVNLSACLLVGLVAGIFGSLLAGLPTASAASAAAAHAQGLSEARYILSTGFLGGYSTFSTASVEGYRLFESGHPFKGLGHAGGMLVGSLLLVALGFALGSLA